MRILQFLRRYPISILAVFAVAFVVWLWRDSLVSDPKIEGNTGAMRRVLPPPPSATTDEAVPPANGKETLKLNPRETAQILPKLKPGMLRAEVEVLVGLPAPEDIHPAMVDNGRVTYQTAYEADLGPPRTVRPIKAPRHPMGRDPQPPSRTLVTLEFDATKPGHPLLGIHYPDPLF